MRRTALVLLVAAAGCGGPSPATSAGGKPVGHWVEAARGPDPKSRRHAVAKLGNVGAADPAALPAVAGALRDADPGVRCEAILALVKFGPAAREAGPAVAELARRDPDPKVRDYAKRAAGPLGGEPAP